MIEAIEEKSGMNSDWLITCDGRLKSIPGYKTKPCPSTLDAKNMMFGEAVIYAKNNGWRIKKVYSTWQHLCPNCRG